MNRKLFSLLIILFILVLVLGSVPAPVSARLEHAEPLLTTPSQLHNLTKSPDRLEDAHNVEFIGQIGGATWAVAIQGSYAYAGVGPRLVILNITNPALPTLVGQTAPLPGMVYDVAVAGSYAYVADWDGGLRIINVANPAVPYEAGFYDTPGYAYGVAVAGSYAYVADWDGGLRVINVDNPASPFEAGFYDTPGLAVGVAVAGSYAYVTDWDGWLRVINVANPAAPSSQLLQHAGVGRGCRRSGKLCLRRRWC